MFKKIEEYLASDYMNKLSIAVVYALLSAVSINLFFQPASLYTSGVTGMAQILTTVFSKYFDLSIPLSISIILLNVPLFVIALHKLNKTFTFFSLLAVLLSSFFVQIIPATPLTHDPIMCAIFGGVFMGTGIGFALKNSISSGGLDIVSIMIRKKTGKTIGSISFAINAVIIFLSGAMFGWESMFYSALSIFVSAKVIDVVYTKQKKMQVIIVTKSKDEVINAIQERLRRGITILHGAEGAYHHDAQSVLITVVTRYELPVLKQAMREADPKAFVSISDNVQILGHFYESYET